MLDEICYPDRDDGDQKLSCSLGERGVQCCAPHPKSVTAAKARVGSMGGVQIANPAEREAEWVNADGLQPFNRGRHQPFAVMDAFAEPSYRKSAAANFLAMFVYLSSGSRVYTPAQLHAWLRDAGFRAPRRIPILRIPGQAMYVAKKA